MTYMQPQRSVSMVSASRKTGPAAKPGAMMSMHIEPADNGYVVEVRRKMAPPPKESNEPYDYEAGTERKVFTDPAQLAAYVQGMCGGGKAKG